jgi:hypothetical protein
MPTPNSDAEAALHKLGQRPRHGFVQQHPISDRSLQTVIDAVREQWEKEQAADRGKNPAPQGAKERGAAVVGT